MCKDMLVNLTTWSEEHYKLNTERYLQKLVISLQQAGVELSFESILQYMPVDKFHALSAQLLKEKIINKTEHLLNIEIGKTAGKIAESAAARFSTIKESELGNLFSPTGVDIFTALQEKAVILFVLNPLIYPETSPLVGRLILIDAKKAVSKLFGNQQKVFFLFDEISNYACEALLDLVNKSRSANVVCTLATQSLSDLANVSDAFKEQIIENCNNYLVLRQNSAVNAEGWAKILGTKATMSVTYQVQQESMKTSTTGLGSARLTREFLYHPGRHQVSSHWNGYFYEP